MGPSTRNGRSIFPRSEGTNRSGHTTSGVRTSTVASYAGRTHHNQYVLRHNCKQNFLFARLPTITSGASYPSPLCPHALCLVHACSNVLFAHVCHRCCVCIDLSSQIFAYGPHGGCVHAPLSLCMHAHC